MDPAGPDDTDASDERAAAARAVQQAQVRRLAGIIETNTVRINRIVEDVLSISRREPPAIEAIDLRRFLPAFVAEYCASVPGFGPPDRIAVRVDSAQPMPFDPNHLRQILVNVLGNASRYASRKPAAIVVEWRRQPDDRLELSVADDGPGLAPEVMQHLFEPFFTTEARGTGLGLYLARELCFANGASIRSERRSGDARYPAEFVIEPRRCLETPGPSRDDAASRDGASFDAGLSVWAGIALGDAPPGISFAGSDAPPTRHHGEGGSGHPGAGVPGGGHPAASASAAHEGSPAPAGDSRAPPSSPSTPFPNP